MPAHSPEAYLVLRNGWSGVGVFQGDFCPFRSPPKPKGGRGILSQVNECVFLSVFWLLGKGLDR